MECVHSDEHVLFGLLCAVKGFAKYKQLLFFIQTMRVLDILLPCLLVLLEIAHTLIAKSILLYFAHFHIANLCHSS